MATGLKFLLSCGHKTAPAFPPTRVGDSRRVASVGDTVRCRTCQQDVQVIENVSDVYWTEERIAGAMARYQSQYHEPDHPEFDRMPNPGFGRDD